MPQKPYVQIKTSNASERASVDAVKGASHRHLAGSPGN
jgi:hypothetical protein